MSAPQITTQDIQVSLSPSRYIDVPFPPEVKDLVKGYQVLGSPVMSRQNAEKEIYQGHLEALREKSIRKSPLSEIKEDVETILDLMRTVMRLRISIQGTNFAFKLFKRNQMGQKVELSAQDRPELPRGEIGRKELNQILIDLIHHVKKNVNLLIYLVKSRRSQIKDPSKFKKNFGIFQVTQDVIQYLMNVPYGFASDVYTTNLMYTVNNGPPQYYINKTKNLVRVASVENEESFYYISNNTQKYTKMVTQGLVLKQTVINALNVDKLLSNLKLQLAPAENNVGIGYYNKGTFVPLNNPNVRVPRTTFFKLTPAMQASTTIPRIAEKILEKTTKKYGRSFLAPIQLNKDNQDKSKLGRNDAKAYVINPGKDIYLYQGSIFAIGAALLESSNNVTDSEDLTKDDKDQILAEYSDLEARYLTARLYKENRKKVDALIDKLKSKNPGWDFSLDEDPSHRSVLSVITTEQRYVNYESYVLSPKRQEIKNELAQAQEQEQAQAA